MQNDNVAQKTYIVTFHTHAGALYFEKQMSALGKDCELRPVPRVVSSSCGICAFFNEWVGTEYFGEDADHAYEKIGMDYKKLWSND